jgi:hypothetical protein
MLTVRYNHRGDKMPICDLKSSRLLQKNVFFLCVFFLGMTAWRDEVDFKNGQEVATQIVDTTGCSIKIMRNGNQVDIKKNSQAYNMENRYHRLRKLRLQGKG